jgi:hypothetical protein
MCFRCEILLWPAEASLTKVFLFISVADPGCLSRIPDPDFYPSRISDPESKNLTREVKKKLLSYLFCSYKFNII